ncbi:MAG: hypothetical protein DHS20C01_30580 [marine bacterium B5-7]|nr:MAG: hypothetical protein DHS20C01_30580 [marine bacterium B5-7]
MTSLSRPAIGLEGASCTLSELLALRHLSEMLTLGSKSSGRSLRAGGHISKIRGRGMSFSESRLYQPGDDIRLVDWKVTARSGRVHTKVFEEEKERPVFVIADLTDSLFFGTRRAFKHVVAIEIAALVGWATLQRNDRIGALLVSSKRHVELRPAAGRRSLMRLLRMLEQFSTGSYAHSQSIELSDALRRANEVVTPDSLVFVASDFYGFNDSVARHLVRLSAHNDVVLCQVLDRLELEHPPPGKYPISDGRQITEWSVVGRRLGQKHPASEIGRLGDSLTEPVSRLARRHRLLYGVISAGESVAAQLDQILSKTHSVTIPGAA